MPDITNPDKICECGHAKQIHHGGRGMCHATTAGYHFPLCKCSVFRVRTPQFERMRKLEDTLRVALDFLENSPDGGWRMPEREERLALVSQIQKALAFFTVPARMEIAERQIERQRELS